MGTNVSVDHTAFIFMAFQRFFVDHPGDGDSVLF